MVLRGAKNSSRCTSPLNLSLMGLICQRDKGTGDEYAKTGQFLRFFNENNVASSIFELKLQL